MIENIVVAVFENQCLN